MGKGLVRKACVWQGKAAQGRSYESQAGLGINCGVGKVRGSGQGIEPQACMQAKVSGQVAGTNGIRHGSRQ